MSKIWNKKLPPIQRTSFRVSIGGNKFSDAHQINVLNYRNEDTLIYDKKRNIYKETDQNFTKDVRRISKVKGNVILQMLNERELPQGKITQKNCDELDYAATVHAKANKVNENSRLNYQNINEPDQCQCGCNKGKGKPISLCTNQQKLDFLGPGVLLHFFFNKVSFIILLFLIVIYTIFGCATNLKGNEAISHQKCLGDSYCIFKILVSDQNKKATNNLYIVQEWLGLGFCVFWIFALRVFKYIGKQKNKVIDKKLNSSSDFAIKVTNLPRGVYQEKQLIAYFHDMWKMKQIEQKMKKREIKEKNKPQQIDEEDRQRDELSKLEIKAIHIIYDLQFVRNMVATMFKLAKQIDDMLQVDEKGDKKKNLITNNEYYLQKKETLKQTYELLLDLRKRFLTCPAFRKRLSSTSCILIFQKAAEQKRFLKYTGQEKISLLKTLQLRIQKCCFPKENNILFKGKMLKIQRAPEPSDLIWTNCQKSESLLRKLAIFGISFLIMIFSYGIIAGLDYLQKYLQKNPVAIKASFVDTAINVATSFALILTNQLLWFAMSYLLDLQYNHSKTDKIISQMNKVVLLSSINIIVLPIISNYLSDQSKNFIYGNKGLAGLAFDYHISQIISVVRGLFNSMTMIKVALIFVRFTRRIIIRFLTKNSYAIDYKKGDPNVNKFYEGPQFDIAGNYVTIIVAILHAAFFCRLQPIILLIVTFMILTFLVVNKIKLLRVCKIPQMTEYLVFDNAIYLLGYVPIYFGAGSIVLSYFQSLQDPVYIFSFISPTIAIGLGVLGLMNPKGVLNRIIKAMFSKCTCINIENYIDGEQVESQQSETQHNMSTSSKSQEANGESWANNANNRQESYYQSSNMLALFGFQKTLRGETQDLMEDEVKEYCEQFFEKREKLTYGVRNITKSIINKQIGDRLCKIEKIQIPQVGEYCSNKSLRTQSQKQNVF